MAATRWWLRPVSNAARVGEQMAVVWKALYARPLSASVLSVGVLISPPKVDAWPKPTSSSRMMSTFGAPGLRCWGCARRLCTESCSRGLAILAEGTGGKGRTLPSSAWAATAGPADSSSAIACRQIRIPNNTNGSPMKVMCLQRVCFIGSSSRKSLRSFIRLFPIIRWGIKTSV